MSFMESMGTAGARIAFLCAKPAHVGKNGAAKDHLTIHEGVWAYCPSDAHAPSHDWEPTGGVSLAELELRLRTLRERAGTNGSA